MVRLINRNIKKEDDKSEKKKSILIVDDNKDLRNFLKCSFENQYNILEAGNGNEAWELLQKESPELIISDVMMPDMDGFELCKLIKSTFETSHIPVILLTSLCDKSDQLEGLGLGAEDYITKPFDISLFGATNKVPYAEQGNRQRESFEIDKVG